MIHSFCNPFILFTHVFRLFTREDEIHNLGSRCSIWGSKRLCDDPKVVTSGSSVFRIQNGTGRSKKNWGASILVFVPQTGEDQGSVHSIDRTNTIQFLIRWDIVMLGQGLGAVSTCARTARGRNVLGSSGPTTESTVQLSRGKPPVIVYRFIANERCTPPSGDTCRERAIATRPPTCQTPDPDWLTIVRLHMPTLDAYAIPCQPYWWS